jgi:hypothetical protein
LHILFHIVVLILYISYLDAQVLVVVALRWEGTAWASHAALRSGSSCLLPLETVFWVVLICPHLRRAGLLDHLHTESVSGLSTGIIGLIRPFSSGMISLGRHVLAGTLPAVRRSRRLHVFTIAASS